MSLNSLLPMTRQIIAAVVLGFTVVISIGIFLPSKTENPPSVETAEYFYWVALADAGNINLLDQGLQIVGELSGGELEDAEVLAIKSDLEEQRDMGHDTFGGIFPLARFALNPQIDLGAPFGIYETIDEVEVVAAAQATSALLDHIAQNYKGTTGFDVLFIPSPELGESLINEALYLFNQNPRFFVHNKTDQERFQNEALNPELRALFKSGKVNSQIIDAAQRYFEANSLIVFDLARQNSARDASFFVAKAGVYRNQSDIADSTIRNMGFAIDRTGIFPTIALVLTMGLLLVFSFRLKELWTSNAAHKIVAVSVLTSSVAWFAAPTFLHASRQFLPVFSLETLAFSSFPIAVIISIVWGSGLVYILYSGWEKVAPSLSSNSAGLSNKTALQSLSLGSSIWLLTVGLVYDPTAVPIVVAYVTVKFFTILAIVSPASRSARQSLNALVLPSIILDFALLHFSDLSLVVFAGVATVVAYWRMSAGNFSNQNDLPRPVSEPVDLVATNETIDKSFDLLVHAESLNKGIQIIVLESVDEDYGEFVAHLLTKACASRATFSNSELMECGLSEWDFVELLAGERLDSDSNHQSEDGIVSELVGGLPFAAILAMGQSAPDLDRKNILQDALAKFKNRITASSAVFAVLYRPPIGTASVEFLKLLKNTAGAMTDVNLVFYLFCGHQGLQVEPDLRHLADQHRKIEQPNRELSKLYIRSITSDLSNDQLESTVDFLISEDGVCDPKDIRSLCQRLETLLGQFEDFSDVLDQAANETDTDLVASVRKVCDDRSHHELLLVSSLLMNYTGRIPINALSKILGRDEQSIFNDTDLINQQYPIYYDPKSREIVLRFRSKELEKAMAAALDVRGSILQKESFHQLLISRTLAVIIADNMLRTSDSDLVLQDLSLIPCSDARALLKPLITFVVTRYIAITKALHKGVSQTDHHRKSSDEYFAKLNKLIVLVDEFLQVNELDHGAVYTIVPDYLFLQSSIRLVEIQIRESSPSTLLSHLQETVALLEKYPLRFFTSDEFLIYLVHNLAHVLQGIRPQEVPAAEFDLLRVDFKARIENFLEYEHPHSRPNWVRVRLELILALQDRGSHSPAEQALVVERCRKLLHMVPAWSRDASELLVRSLVLRNVSNMDSTATDASQLADEAVGILLKFSDFENIPATYGAAARAQYFPAVKAEEAGQFDLAIASYKRFLNILPQWLNSSEEYPSSDQSFNAKNALMARTFEARAYAYLAKHREISEEDLNQQVIRLRHIATSWIERGHGREENLGSLLSELTGLMVITGVLTEGSVPSHLIAQIDALLENAPPYVGDRWKKQLRQEFVEKFTAVDN